MAGVMMGNAAEAPWLPLVEQARQLDPDPALADVDDAALEDQVRDVASQVAALTCQWLDRVAEFVIRGVWADRGARTPGQWLSWACGVGPRAAREYVRVGLALRQLPQTRQRFAAGTISYSKVRAVTRVATPDTEQPLVQLADSAPAADLERIIAGARTQLARTTSTDTDELAARVDMPALSRRTGTDGMVEYGLRLPVEMAEALDQQLDRLVELADTRHDQPTLPHGDGGNADGDEVEVVAAGRVPYGQRQAQALCQAVATAVADAGPDRSGQDRHLIVFHTHLDHLLHTRQPGPTEPDAHGDDDRQGGSAEPEPDDGDDDPEGGSAEPDDGDGEQHGGSAEPPIRRRRLSVVAGRHRAMAIPASALRLLGCDTLVRTDHTDHTGHNGHPADAGRTTRTAPQPLRRALLLRDHGCRFPGCGRTRHLHAHHVTHWADGGPTDLANLLLLCSYHHRFIHTAHWTLHPVDPAAGHYRFAPPAGTPTNPTGTLPGPAEPFAPVDPWPRALEPPWWHGDPYDLSDTINAVAELVLDPATFFTHPRTHPAHEHNLPDAA